MSYTTQTEVEAYTSFGYTDFKQAGRAMTQQEWAAYLTQVINGVDQAINRFCGVQSFEEHEVTEYHDGRGMTGDRGRSYKESDRTILPIQQPVIEITEVAEDIGQKPGLPNWQVRHLRSELDTGDYEIMGVAGHFQYIRFFQKVPRKGNANVRILYTAGYPDNSPELDDIRLIALEMVANHLFSKKKDQESIAARMTPTRDAAEMIMSHRPGTKMDDDSKERLLQYRRNRLGMKAWR